MSYKEETFIYKEIEIVLLLVEIQWKSHRKKSLHVAYIHLTVMVLINYLINFTYKLWISQNVSDLSANKKSEDK